MLIRFAVAHRAWILFCALALIGSVRALDCRADNTQANLSRGPYLQLATPESIVIVWRTDGPSDPSVRIGASADQLDRVIDPDAITLRVAAGVEAAENIPRLYLEPPEDAAERDPRKRDPSTAPGTCQYEARLDGLKPDTRYFYAVYDGDRRLAGGDDAHHFTTSPIPGSKESLRVWVVGDSGTGGRDQRQVYEATQGFLRDSGRELDAYLHMGDMAYPDGTDREFQRTFFDVYQQTLRNTVCWPTMGNHEGHTSRGMLGFGPYYDAYVVPTAAEAGGVASGSEAYYSFDIANVHFVCLDSHDLDRAPTGAMAQWLVADLEQAKADWLIAFWHHPPYTKGSHDSDREGQLIEMRTHIMPILESGGVDLVLAGHSHIYERSMLIDGAYSTPTTAQGVVLDDGDGKPEGDGPYKKSAGLNPHEGTVAVVSGHGGAGISRKGTMPIMREIIVEHGSVILDIEGDTLTGTMVNKEQVLRDVFSIVKSGKVTPTRVAQPWQPEHDLSVITEVILAWDQDSPGQPPRRWRVRNEEQGSLVVQQRPDSSLKEAVATAKDEPLVAVYRGFRGYLAQIETEVEIPAASTSPAGVVFGFENAANYYIFRVNVHSRTAELVRREEGRDTVVSSKEVTIPLEGELKLELEVVRNVIEVQLEHDQEELEYAITLDEDVPEGRFGVFVGAGGTAKYQTITIERGTP
jgi:hypothetical protein